MTADELRDHAVYITRLANSHPDAASAVALGQIGDYLRACADALDAGPVAWKKEWPNGSVNLWDGQNKPPLDIIGETHPLYPVAMPGALRLPEPMTEDALRKIANDQDPAVLMHREVREFARAIEAEVMRRVREANE